MIFSVIPGNPSGIEFLYQEKVFVAGRVSGNEQPAATAEKRKVDASGLLLHMLCCAGVQPRLLSAIYIHLT